MPSVTALAADLRREQIKLADRLVLDLVEVFGALNFKGIDTSAPGWAAAVIAATTTHHRAAAELGATMYLDLRREVGVKGPVNIATPDLDRGALEAALALNGPYAAKHGMAIGRRISELAPAIFANTAGAATKLALAGSRDTIEITADTDPKALSYVRIASAKPCDFCALMTQKSYLSMQSAGTAAGTRNRALNPRARGASYHAHCRCTVVPYFSADSWPDGAHRQAETYADLWKRAASFGGTEQQITKRFFDLYSEIA
ncbi:hypothetical protein M2390_002933 [Mycetocola sp. BIGb0189]|uniref:VG15 protein n=1 Tax=Mycetocola sp. BIGb0189 TaxID=2940604 RepID=UPI00216A33F6|nr:hypothetical protein [Mycetocola sp. BIGb0189]MCS4277724.1 hypothetical protein [Mycetocola sp. BIGb0189]